MAQQTHNFRGGIVTSLVALAQLSTVAMAAYQQPGAVVDGAGGNLASASYRNLSVVAQPIPAGSCAGAKHINRTGFLHHPAATGNLLPDYTVTLSFAGNGSGIVTSLPAGIQCNTACSGTFNAFFPVQLSAAAAPYMVFSGWGGGCSGTAGCLLDLQGNVSVTATFLEDRAHSVYVPGGTPGSGYYSTLQAAYDATPDGSAVWAWGVIYAENLDCAAIKDVTIMGGFDQGYATQVGITVLEGTLTVGNGSVTVDRLAVR